MFKKSRFLIISLILILIGTALSLAIDTSFGTVKIQNIRLVDDDGYTVTGSLYIPKGAGKDTPAPGFILAPGGDCNSGIIAPYANELSRRGYVVFALDYSGAGDTEINPEQAYFTNNGTMECVTAYDYLASLDFVDKDSIGAGGHSMGSLYSYRLGLQRKLSIQISNVLYDDALPDYNMNYVVIAAKHDEGILSRIKTLDNLFTYPFLTDIFGTEQIIPGQLYGSWENGNARILHLVNNTHNDDMVSPAFIRLFVDSAMNGLTAPNPIPADNLIYAWKIAGLAIAMVGMIMFLFSLAGLLLQTDSFCCLILPEQAYKGVPLKSKLGFGLAAIITLLPVLTFFPGTAAGNQMHSNYFFRLGSTPNGYMIWSLISGIALFFIFMIYHYFIGKKQNGNLTAYGLYPGGGVKPLLSYIGKAFIFALMMFLAAYFILMLIFHYGKTDLHIWALSLRPLNDHRWATYPAYYLALAPYFCLSLLAGDMLHLKSDSQKQGKGLWKNILSRTFIGLIGLIALFAVYEVILRFTSTGPFYTGHFAHFYMTLLETIIPIFGVSTALAYYINKKTHSKYIGIFIGTALIAFCMVASNNMVL